MRIVAAWLLVCAACPVYADHPLISEDAELLGKGKWQLQLHGERARDRDEGSTVRTTETGAQLTYGLRDDTDLQVHIPYIRETTEGAVTEGRGDAVIAYKRRFFEGDKVELVAKPAVWLPTGRDELGLGRGRVSWSADLVALYKAAQGLELLSNMRHDANRNRIGERTSLWHVSAAALWKASDRLQLLVNVARESNVEPGGDIQEVVGGLIYEAAEAIELALGLKKGLSDSADDRAVLFGVKIRW